MESKKRPEENNKFVFKMTLKKLKNKFINQNEDLNLKEDFEYKFYCYYFDKVAREQNLKVMDFKDPLNDSSRK